MKNGIIKFWKEKQGRILQMALGAIVLLFIGILISVYIIAERSNVIFLDEKGNQIHSHE